MARQWPMKKDSYTLTSGFGPRWGTHHSGLDFGAPDGTPFYACAGGTVKYIGAANGYGQWIVIDHPASEGGGCTEYGHMWNAYATGLKVGDWVSAGQLIGFVGSNGQSTGPHLHLTVWEYAYGGKRIDPEVWLQNSPHPGEVPMQPGGLTANALGELMGWSLSESHYAQLLPSYVKMLNIVGATSINSLAMIGAQLGHESVGLKYQEEIASGSAYEWRSDLGNTQAGDGVLFKGHGWIQVTGRHNHTAVSKWAYTQGIVPTSDYFVTNPKELGSDEYCWVGPAWYLTQARPGFLGAADRGDLETCTRMINGGLNGLADRRARFNRALAMGERLKPITEENIFMALSDDEQRELLDKTRRIHHELTHEFQSLVTNGQGEQSAFRATMIGYVLQADRKLESMHQHILPGVLTAIQKLFKKDGTDAE